MALMMTATSPLGLQRAGFFVEMTGFDSHGNVNKLPKKMKEIDVDMDLYCKLQGNRQALSFQHREF